jgi:hypothetical protein
LGYGRYQINHDDEPHGETTETAKFIQEDQLSKIVDRRVDPPTTLGQQNLPVVRSNRVGVGIPNEHGLVLGEVLQQQGSQITIFTQVEEIFHVQRIDPIFLIVLDERVGNEQRFVSVRCP